MTTLTSIQTQIEALPARLRAAVEQRERTVTALFDSKRRQLHGDTIHREKVTAANQTLFAALDRLTADAADAAKALQQAQDSADPLLAFNSMQLARWSALWPVLAPEAQTVNTDELERRVRGALAGADDTVKEVYRRVLPGRREATLRAGNTSGWNSRLDDMLHDLQKTGQLGDIAALQETLTDLRIQITRTRQQADGTAEKARNDFEATIRQF